MLPDRTQPVGLRHLVLQFDRAGHCVDRACEFDQHAVTHHLDDASVVMGHQRRQDGPPTFPQCSKCARLALFDKPAVAGHIGSQYGGETPLGAFFGHCL